MSLTACQNGTGQAKGFPMDNKMEWLVAASAPRGYDIELVGHHNYFIQNDGSTDYGFMSGQIGAGWGESSTLASNLPTKSPIPKAVNLRWISINENQFYEGRFELPQAKIEQMLRDGYESRRSKMKGTRETYSYLTIGFAPGGGVVLWLSNQTRREVAYFKAKPIDMDWREFLGNYTYMDRKEWIKMSFDTSPKYIQEQIRTKTLPIGLWELYRNQYPWSLQLKGGSLQEYWAEFVNGEQYMTFNKELATAQSQRKPVPNALEIYFTDQSGQRYKGTLKLNGFTTYKAYHAFYEHMPNRHGQLLIDLSSSTGKPTVKLKEDDLRSTPIPVDSWQIKPVAEGY